MTGGNITVLTDQLVDDGLVDRVMDPADRRAMIVKMTPKGKAWFERIAKEHEQWLNDLLGRLAPQEMDELYSNLGHLRVKLAQDDLPD